MHTPTTTSSPRMSFLSRRRSMAPSRHHVPDTSIPAMPFPPPVENLRNMQTTFTSPNDKSSSHSRMFRRVSTLLTGRKKRQPAVTPLNTQPIGSSWRVISNETSPTDSDFSIEEIRRPSGLGRPISISSKRSLPQSPLTMIGEESPFQHMNYDRVERIRTLSSPNLTRSRGVKQTVKSVTSDATRISDIRLEHCPPRIPELPVEVLTAILSFLPRYLVTTLAHLSHNFCNAARIVLYETLDLRNLQLKQVEKLVTSLAYRQELTDLIKVFECYTWPVFFPPQSDPTTRGHTHLTSFSPSLTATFTVAFQNMNHITSLVLPSFDYTFLRHHSAFGLKKLTFLSSTMTSSESNQLFLWLNGQTNITHLAFPNLMDSNDTPTSLSVTDTPQNGRHSDGLKDSLHTPYSVSPSLTPSGSPTTPFSPPRPTTPRSPFNSPSLLPALTTLVATPSIISSLMSSNTDVLSRPLQTVAISINSTLYSGLRPAALFNPLYGITRLTLKFGPNVDKRTIGKVLSTAATLSHPSDNQGNDATDASGALRVLEIELAVYTFGLDTALYKMIAASLPRYQGLVELCTRFTPDPHSESAIPSVPPALLDHEYAQVNTWVKHCPSIQSVELLSGAKWRRTKS